ncbi:MAG TPA: hypothetical protein VF490_13110 [Chryseosolibacter sp.]
MRTSLSDLIRTERYLLGELSAGEALLYQAEMALNHRLKTDTFFHRLIHRAVRLYHRKKIMEAVALTGEKILNDPARAGFRNEVMKNFNRES